MHAINAWIDGFLCIKLSFLFLFLSLPILVYAGLTRLQLAIKPYIASSHVARYRKIILEEVASDQFALLLLQSDIAG